MSQAVRPPSRPTGAPVTTVAFLVAHEGIEQIELTTPWKEVQDAGATPLLVSTTDDQVQGFDHLDSGRHLRGRPSGLGRRRGRLRPAAAARWCRQPRCAAHGRDRRQARPRRARGRQARRRHLPRAVDAGRGRRRPGTHRHVVAEPAHRPAQRRRHLGRRGARGRPRGPRPADHQPQPRRPRGVLQGGRRPSSPDRRSVPSSRRSPVRPVAADPWERPVPDPESEPAVDRRARHRARARARPLRTLARRSSTSRGRSGGCDGP